MVTTAARFVVGFDLGGTLVTESMPSITPLSEEFTRDLGLTVDELSLHVTKLLMLLVRAERETGVRQRTAQDIIDAYLDEQKLDLEPDIIDDAMWQLFGGAQGSFLAALPGAVELLQELAQFPEAQQGRLSMVALSNTSLPEGVVYRFLEARRILCHLDAVILSSVCGVRKPAPESFAYMLRAVGANRDDCVMYIGNDCDNDIVPVTKLGHHAIYIAQSDTKPDTSLCAETLSDVSRIVRDLIGPH